ncbi:SusC/RagA family TonB-linked outer membrane protein [Butyricimonas hominis]|uniref:SusC/RagA family TonB-linked outer membrane protein n=1 Tax=Butyricimonas TaxID=574697 RepID=UPI0035167EA6
MKKNRINVFCGQRKTEWMLSKLRGISLLILMVVGFLSTYGQTQRVSLRLENESLVKVLSEIERLSNYSFVFKMEDVENVVHLTVRAENKMVKEILDSCLLNSGLSYLQENNLIIIKKMAPKVKSVVVTGVVKDEQGYSIPGVTVLIMGTSLGTVTDEDGKFELEFNEGQKIVLRFSFIGMKTKEIVYSGQKNIEVVLEENVTEMNEVVVTGYQVIDRKKLTSAVSSVKAKDIMVQGAMSIDQMLKGRIPDMMMTTNSGEVGVVPRIRIRGTSTLIGNREPLWVVDGIVLNDPVPISPEELNDPDYVNRIGNAIAGLNPQDIDRIDVLKDASATALYGTKAANGVIVITTKKGHVGNILVRYNATGTFKLRPRYTDRKVNVMNSKQRVDFSKDLVANHHVYPSDMPQVGYEGLITQMYQGVVSGDEFTRKVKDLERMNTDWFKILTEDVFSHQHTISLSGGSEQLRYYASIGYAIDNDVIKGANNERYTASLNFDAHFSDCFTLALSLLGNVSSRKYNQSGINVIDYAYTTSRCIPAYDEKGRYYYKPSSTDYNFNILNELENSHSNQEASGFTCNANLNYRVTDWLNAQAILSYSTSNTEQEGYWSDKTNYVANMRGSEYGVEPPKGEYTHSLCPYGGELTKIYDRNNSYTARLQLDMNKSFGENFQHNIVTNLGFEASSTRAHGYNRVERGYYEERGKQFAADVNIDDYPAYKSWLGNNYPSISDNLSNLIAAYISVSYTYNNLFTLNANTRIDGSNKFGDRSNEKLLPIWSVSGSYNISEHMNMDPRWVSNLALRLSYGFQGNMLDGQSPVMILKKLPLNAHYNELMSKVEVYPNPSLKWEKTSSFNVGLDFGLFNNALQVNTSYYYKLTKDAFMNRTVSSVNGRKSYVINSGEIRNSGYSVDVSLSPVSTDNFRWTLSTSFSQVFNEMNTVPGAEEYELDDFLSGNALTKGHAVGTFYSYKFLGLNPVDGGPMFDTMQERKEELIGKSKYDVFTTILTPSGQRDPKIQGGLNNSFRYKSLRLNISFNYSLGSKVRLFKLYDNGIEFSALENVNKDLTKRWRNPGDERYTNIPCMVNATTGASKRYGANVIVGENIMVGENAWTMYNYGSQRVVSGNYLQCQDLSLTYDVPEKWLNRIGLTSLSVTASTSNVFTICSSKLKGQAPTQSGFAEIQLSDRPAFSLGLNVAF